MTNARMEILSKKCICAIVIEKQLYKYILPAICKEGMDRVHLYENTKNYFFQGKAHKNKCIKSDLNKRGAGTVVY